MPELEFLGLAIELDDRRLIHVAEPQIAVAVGAQAERAGGEIRLVQRHRIFLDRAGLRIETAEELLAEARVPDDAVGIDDDVVRLDRWPPEIVFGVNHARGPAGGARQGRERKRPL